MPESCAQDLTETKQTWLPCLTQIHSINYSLIHRSINFFDKHHTTHPLNAGMITHCNGSSVSASDSSFSIHAQHGTDFCYHHGFSAGVIIIIIINVDV